MLTPTLYAPPSTPPPSTPHPQRPHPLRPHPQSIHPQSPHPLLPTLYSPPTLGAVNQVSESATSRSHSSTCRTFRYVRFVYVT